LILGASLLSRRLCSFLYFSVLTLDLWVLFQTLSFVLAKGFWIYELGGWAPPWGIGLVETPFNALLSGFILVVAILAWFYVRKLRLPGPTGASRERWLLSLFLFFTGTALGLLLIRDAFSLYLLLEVLVIFWAGTILLLNPKGAMDAFRILLWGSAASTLYLFGMLFLTASAGTVQLDDLLAQLLTSKTPGVALAAGIFAVFAWAFPALFPTPFLFNRLLNHTPSFITGFLVSMGGRATGYLLFVLCFFTLNVPGLVLPLWMTALFYLLVILFLTGFVFASRQRDFQHAMAFLAVAQEGYLLAGFILGNKSGLAGSLLELLSQTLAVTGLFFVSESFRQGAGPHPLSQLIGMARHRFWTWAALMVFLASAVGIPPTGGFFAKFYLFQGALEKHDWVLLGILSAVVLFNLFYLGKFTFYLCEHRPSVPDLPPPAFSALFPIMVLAAGVLLLGVFHQEILHTFVEPALPRAFQNLPVPNVPFLGKAVE
jgi:multicomponent Na+:H+ antiporter subunit D